jgi:hypothetical protein
MKAKLERELGGLRGDRKRVAESMERYIQVEHMGQYTLIPVKEGIGQLPVTEVEVRMPSGKTYRRRQHTSIGQYNPLGEKSIIHPKNLTEEERPRYGNCHGDVEEWCKKTGGKHYLSSDGMHSIGIKGNIVYDPVKKKEYDLKDYLEKTGLVFEELEPVMKEDLTKRDLIAGAIGFAAGYMLAKDHEKKKEPVEEVDLLIDEAEKELKGEEK